MIRLVIFSEDSKVQPQLAASLGSDYSVVVESNKQKIKSLMAEERLDILMMDFDSDDSSREQQLAFVDEIGNSPLPILVMTDDPRRSTAMDLLQRGVYDCLHKPISMVELQVVVRRAYEHASLRAELARTRRAMSASTQCDQLMGSSGRSQAVYDLIHRVANLSAFVLITGESGTGKELVARAIHNLSDRAKFPFVAVSCGAIPETLIESELFGHEKGAFTGTNGAREGYLEQAGNGTLFLDEIGELSLQTQVKLLRVLQQREFSRLGSNKLIPLRARVLFATHRNLGEMVEQGTFRRDLYFRVNVVKIQVPALRDRSEDIPPLAYHFLRRYAAEYNKLVTDIRPSAMELLVDYDWPGNIRELENVIQGAVILTDGDSISADHLPRGLQQWQNGPVLVCNGDNSDGSFEERLRQYRLALVNQAIAECHGNKAMAARNLGISRPYLHRLIRGEGEAAATA